MMSSSPGGRVVIPTGKRPYPILLLAVVLVACVGLAARGEEEPEASHAPAAKDLAFLAGTWRQDGQDGLWEEVWLPPRGDSAVAMTRWVQSGKTRLYELTAVEDGEDGAFFRLRHFHAGLEPSQNETGDLRAWRFVRCQDREAVFEDAEGAFPQRFVYHRVGDDVLDVRLEGMGADAEKKAAFRFTRVEAE